MGQTVWYFIIKPSPADLASKQSPKEIWSNLQGNFAYVQIGSGTQLVSGGGLALQRASKALDI